MRTTSYEYRLEGLACANCAAKIEQLAGQQDGIENASLAFATQTLTVSAEPGLAGELFQLISDIVKQVEPGVRVHPFNRAAAVEEHPHVEIPADPTGKWIVLLVAALSLIAGVLPFPTLVKLLLFTLSILCSIIPTAIKAFSSLKRLQLDENTLVVVAVIAAFALGEHPEAALVSLLFELGEWLESYAVGRSRKSIEALSKIRPDTAHLVAECGVKTVPAQDVSAGDIIEVNPHERVPVDAQVLEGSSLLDLSALTGESVPVEAHEGTEVLSGALNGEGLLRMKVLRPYSESAATRILELVKGAAAKKGSHERLMTRFARIYTPAILAAAVLLTVIPLFFGGEFTVWLSRALVFLVAACPCALVISIPLAYFSSIGAASKMGVLMKGGNYVEQMAKLKALVLDKTGTLTTGKLSVQKVISGALGEQDTLKLLAVAEAHSSHPIALAIRAAAGNPAPCEGEYRETAGYGVTVHTGSHTLLAGSKRWMKQNGIDTGDVEASVYLAVDKTLGGAVVIGDTPRENARQALDSTRALGVQRIVMITGDTAEAAQKTAGQCGIEEFYHSMLPQDKVEHMLKVKSETGLTAFVGDGINDAPVLAAADIGVAMGFGSDAAIESADVVLSSGNLERIPDVIRLSRRTMNLITFNTIFALVVKAAVLVLGAFGLAAMWMAVFADVGVSILSVLNASRLLAVKTNRPTADSYPR